MAEQEEEEEQHDEAVRRIVGVELAETDLRALGAWYAAIARSIAAFPARDLKRVEPPLRSVAGPLL